MPIEIVREEVITFNRTKIVNAPIPKVIVENQTATFDPLANISTNQLQSLSFHAIQSLINKDDPHNLSSIISSMLLVFHKNQPRHVLYPQNDGITDSSYSK